MLYDTPNWPLVNGSGGKIGGNIHRFDGNVHAYVMESQQYAITGKDVVHNMHCDTDPTASVVQIISV